MKRALPYLSVPFSGFLVYLFDKIWGNSINWTKISSIRISEFLTKEIAFYEIMIFIILSVLLYLIIKKIIGKKDQYYSRKQRKLRKFNNFVDQENNILLRWKVYFDYDTPFISELTPFCREHKESTMRFVNGSCPIENCRNNRPRGEKYDTTLLQNSIESGLIDKWEKIN